jgi:hypothetical protein
VIRNGEPIINRPHDDDRNDPQLRTQTHLEQIQSNPRFRSIAEFFNAITYLHLIPQMLKYGEALGGNRLEDDPFGQGFLERIANCQKQTRDARLRRMEEALAVAVPQFKHLRFERDEMGHPHLEALYAHHRPKAGWQREDQFSDGTLRLLGLLWALLDGESLLLMEEPELSLHEGVVERIPSLIERVQRRMRNRRQVLISTHSEALLRNQSIDPRGIVIIEPGPEGSRTRTVAPAEEEGIRAGLSVADTVLPSTRPDRLDQLSLL